ncbi:MAG: hypothetical protein ACI33N_04090 [Desulfovibrionaceae bacterium]
MPVRHILMLALSFCILLGACARPAPAPHPIAREASLGLAPFTQPTGTEALLLGRLPELQGAVPADTLRRLDAAYAAMLKKSSAHRIAPLPAADAPVFNRFHESGSPRALTAWVSYGRAHRVDMLIVPQVLDWHQREGSPAGVTESAAVRLEFFLLDVRTGAIVNRSITEEKQLGLLEDLSRTKAFFKRHGAWVTAEELAEEAMQKSIKDLGL